MKRLIIAMAVLVGASAAYANCNDGDFVYRTINSPRLGEVKVKVYCEDMSDAALEAFMNSQDASCEEGATLWRDERHPRLGEVKVKVVCKNGSFKTDEEASKVINYSTKKAKPAPKKKSGRFDEN